MPPLYRLIEVAVYSLLNFLPFLALALYPFRHSLRFSRRVTGVLIALVTAGQLLLARGRPFGPTARPAPSAPSAPCCTRCFTFWR